MSAIRLRQATAGQARLRQSVLQRAFTGRLVPQDPDDEPAGVLLENTLRERGGSGINGG